MREGGCWQGARRGARRGWTTCLRNPENWTWEVGREGRVGSGSRGRPRHLGYKREAQGEARSFLGVAPSLPAHDWRTPLALQEVEAAPRLSAGSRAPSWILVLVLVPVPVPLPSSVYQARGACLPRAGPGAWTGHGDAFRRGGGWERTR